MSELDDLYQELILDHSKRPRNHRKLEAYSHFARGFNALCGDRITVYARLSQARVEEVSFEGVGCAICTASASVMTEATRGRSLEEAERLFHSFHQLVTGKLDAGAAGLGKLQVFAGVSAYPVRVKCASLPWHTFKAALDQRQETVSTE